MKPSPSFVVVYLLTYAQLRTLSQGKVIIHKKAVQQEGFHADFLKNDAAATEFSNFTTDFSSPSLVWEEPVLGVKVVRWRPKCSHTRSGMNWEMLIKNKKLAMLNDKVVQPYFRDSENIAGELYRNPQTSNFFWSMWATSLTSIFSTYNNFTVFAFTDQSYKELPEITRRALDNREALTTVVIQSMMHHVVRDAILTSKDLSPGGPMRKVKCETLWNYKRGVQNGDNKWLRIYEDGAGTTWVNDSRIVKADIRVKNGIIHLIDNILTSPFLEKFGIRGKRVPDERKDAPVLPLQQIFSETTSSL
eukprot:Filipodium_phascolosomae@DN5757_c0_g1_i1.p1